MKKAEQVEVGVQVRVREREVKRGDGGMGSEKKLVKRKERNEWMGSDEGYPRASRPCGLCGDVKPSLVPFTI